MSDKKKSFCDEIRNARAIKEARRKEAKPKGFTWSEAVVTPDRTRPTDFRFKKEQKR